MNENGKKKREWVKTAAIVFLSVMLVLTFFSNTIMNYSLPEVATQYVQSGSITAKIRGSGVVESSDPYNLEVKESRKVAGVAVKVGDTVEKDAVLMYLEDEESEELKEARKQLETYQNEYQKAILSAESSAGLVDRVESGNTTSAESKLTQIDNYNRKIDQLEDVIKGYSNRISEIDAELGKLSNDTTVDTFAEQVAVNNAQAELEKATNAVPTAEANLAAAQATLESVNSAVKAAQDMVTACETAVEEARNGYTARLNRKTELETRKNNNETLTPDEEVELERLNGPKENPDSVTAASALQAEAETDLKEAQDALAAAENSIEADRKAAQDILNERDAEYQKALNDKRICEENLAEAQRVLANKQAETPDTSYRDALNNEKADLSAARDKANTEKEDASSALTELLASFSKEADLVGLLKNINDQQKVVDELTEKAVDAVIKAPIAGTVTALNVTAGKEIDVSAPVAVLQPEGKGYTMSFSVTNEQAKRLSVGDVAELVNAWRFDDVNVTLASMKPDPAEPGQKKLLTFDISGNVTAGQNLNVSVGQKSANYDYIVPNSAIREDNNGKFILIVESKPGPLSTRYIASRVDVEVLASDDTQSAISGALYGYEFVITTSTKPVEAGKQVRLNENNG